MNQLLYEPRAELPPEADDPRDREIAELTRRNASLTADLRDATVVVRGQREVIEAAAAFVRALDRGRHKTAMELPAMVALRKLKDALLIAKGADDADDEDPADGWAR